MDDLRAENSASASLREEGTPERNTRLTGQAVGLRFVIFYAMALVGLWIALLTPASVTLAIRISQISPLDKTASLAFVASLGAAAALFSNPVFGALSDRCTLRWGQRRPFIVGGFAIGVSAIAAIGLAESIAFVAVGWVVAQLSFNAAITALVAILPERVPQRIRGRVAGLMGMAPQLGIVTGTYLTQIVGTTGYAMFAWPAALGIAMASPFVLTLREYPREREDVGRITLGVIVSALWINPLRHGNFTLAWLGRFFVWIAYYLLINFKTYFLMDKLGYTAKTVAPVLSLAMLTLAVFIIASSTAGGWLSDRVGRRKPFVVIASLLFVGTMIVVALADSLSSFLVGIALSGLAAGLYLGVDYALVSDVLPDSRDEAARGMGLFNLSSTLPQTLAPVLGPVFLSIGTHGGGHAAENYTALFLAGAAFSLAGALFTQMIRTR